MEALLTSVLAVAIAEIGDKTQLLAMALAARWRRPWPIAAGILVATVANHALAALVGASAADWIDQKTLLWIVGPSFLAMAVWMLIPDKEEDGPKLSDKLGPFLATTIAFFVVEMGDKTQIATIALAARYDSVLMVAAGTTLGMMIANLPALWLGERMARMGGVQWAHRIAAALFAVMGIAALVEVLR